MGECPRGTSPPVPVRTRSYPPPTLAGRGTERVWRRWWEDGVRSGGYETVKINPGGGIIKGGVVAL